MQRRLSSIGTSGSYRKLWEEEDVVFLVGPPGYGERMTAKISKLCQASPVFIAMLQGPLRETGGVVRIEDADTRGFSVLINYIQENRLDIRSVPTALSVLYLSHKYIVPDLISPVLQYIIFNTNQDTVLPVLQNLLLYYRPPGLPSAPSLDGSIPTCPASPVPPTHIQLYDKAISVCFSIFDRSAAAVLETEEWEDISRELLELLIGRSSIRINTEVEVATAVLRWGEVQARRQGTSRTAVLANTAYLIRYLTMSAQEFKRGVAGKGLLTTQEEQSLLFCIIRPGAWLPVNLDCIRSALSTPRRWKPTRRSPAWWTRSSSKQINPSTCQLATERRFTTFEKVFLCLACIFD